MMHCDSTMSDWNIVQKKLSIGMCRGVEEYSKKYAAWRQRIGLCHTYESHKQQEVIACIAFLQAHEETLHVVKACYSSIHFAEMEMLEQQNIVKGVLATLDEELVKSIRQKMLVSMALRFQITKVEALEHKGLVNSVDGETMVEEINTALDRVGELGTTHRAGVL